MRTFRALSRAAARHKYGPIYPGYSPASTNLQHSDSPQSIEIHNPADGTAVSNVLSSSSDDVTECIRHAQITFEQGSWSRTSVQNRATVLTKLARLLEDRVGHLAELETLQTGRTIREMRTQLGRLPEWLDYFAALIRTRQGYVAPTVGKLHNYISRVPLGVVAQITPFNHPLLIAVKKIAPALAAGNSVIVKPSEYAPISVLEFAELAIQAGVPPGVLNVLPGTGAVGKELVSSRSVKKVDITAGTETGRQIGSIVGSNLASFTAELGGKTPIIVFEDADLSLAANGAAFSAFIASGQTCVSGSRLLVQDSVYDAFISLFLKKAESIASRMGSPMNPQSTMGTIISHKHLQRIHSMVSRTKGRVLLGGARLMGKSPLDGFDFSGGCFYPPTVVVDISLDDELWKEEVFGPVVVVQKFRSDAVGVQLANESKYGLGAAIWTSDISRAHLVSDLIQTGIVWVNTHHRNDPSSPWGGMKESGIGRENGLEALDSYSQTKSTIINVATKTDMLAEDWFSESTGGKARYG